MKKLLLLLLCVPLMFSCGENSVGNNKQISEDINLEELKEPCDFVDAVSEVIHDLYNLGEENNWSALSEFSEELDEAKDLWKKFTEIRLAGGEMLWNMSESEVADCDSYTDKTEEKQDKVGDWLQTFHEYLD